ncbi:PD-(D/E)XK nuclease-like domain-containing protein [Methylobacterium sp. Gmos1]
MKIVPHISGLVSGAGLYTMPAATYHADPSPAPSLSSGIARTLLDETPRHAFQKHPRLGGTAEDARSRKLDLGSVAHAILTGEGRDVVVVEADAYTNKAAREARDEAIEAGHTPVLRNDLRKAKRMVSAVQARLAETQGAERAFVQGYAETALVWRDRIGIWGRAMLDWWGPDSTEIWDLKTTSGGLSDRAIAARIADGLDIQEHWYRRGLARLNPDLAGRLRFRFVFVETAEPFECRVIELTGHQRWLGERKAVTAAVLFRRGLTTGQWPGYPAEIARVESPDWVARQWEARELSDPLLRDLGAELTLAHSPDQPDTEIAA